MVRIAMIFALAVGPWLGMTGQALQADIASVGPVPQPAPGACAGCCHGNAAPGPRTPRDSAPADPSSCHLKICCMPWTMVYSKTPPIVTQVAAHDILPIDDRCPPSRHSRPAVPPPRLTSSC
jgi:hypothetical protein